MADTSKELILVTGGSGFVAAHCIIKCLAANYRVRTTVRSLKREKDVRDMMTAGKAPNLDDLSFVEADLTSDAGWKEAVQGCTYVMHVASPLLPGIPKDENDIIIPAREGTLRVLRAARDAGVKRVVLTSSFSAMAYSPEGKEDDSVAYTENDWTDTTRAGLPPYDKSKTLAERAAWDFIEKEGGDLELVAVNPALILGPVLSKANSLSVEVILRLMNGSMPACPNVSFCVVDVRDVADMHLLAMQTPEAKGQRFMCGQPGPMWIKDMSLVLRERLGKKAKKAPTRTLPNFVLKILSYFDPALGVVVPQLGHFKTISVDKAKNTLGWKPRSREDAIVATAESFLELGMIKQ